MGRILAPLFAKSNSGTCCAAISAADNCGMPESKKAKIEPVHVEEANRLRAIFSERVSKGPQKRSQQAFGSESGIGNQAMVSHYLLARSPLNLKAALKFAKWIPCSIAEFSPRLAEELNEILELVAALPGAPSNGNVVLFPKQNDPRISEAIRIMMDTDETGRIVCLAGIKGAITGYVPASKTRAES